ncbi:hypothetical protein Sango_1049800 [Sesamum angolense]|uniref:Uncharacterized protein n=1 Tax=Sesamum angolense TaxID=2727404 RepID=A0AAE1X0X4_9LAMI|nr:hypothetical protein Sango_1049800 [Sesamum angolense]
MFNANLISTEFLLNLKSPRLNANLRWNKLQDAIPPEIGELKQLTHLYLSFNNFKGEIPKELANLPELRNLSELKDASQLCVNLYLNNNYLTGGVPSQLANLTNLEILYLSYNRSYFTFLLDYLIQGKLGNLLPQTDEESFVSLILGMNGYLDHNQFSGRIPDTFYKHPFLKEMYIEGNSFRPGVKPIGEHKVLELSDSDFVV